MCANIPHYHDLCNSAAPVLQGNSDANGTSLDKLAQLVTDDENSFELASVIQRTDTQKLLKRARRKYFTNGLTLKLVNASKNNENSALTKSYWNSFHCSSTLRAKLDGTISGKYCKTRWCMVCNAIRTAQYIRNYGPVLDTWDQSYFVTLTAVTVSEENLKERLVIMHKIFTQILGLNRLRNCRNCSTAIDLKGIRKLECTYNLNTKKYHPHFHIICNSKASADYILQQWFTRITKLGIKIDRLAQDVKIADKGSLLELFKYMTKIISKNSKLANGESVIHAKSLDVIFNAFQGRRVIQPFGFKVAKEAAESTVAIDDVVAVYEWMNCITDWVDVESGELLTGYTPSDGMRRLLEG